MTALAQQLARLRRQAGQREEAPPRTLAPTPPPLRAESPLPEELRRLLGIRTRATGVASSLRPFAPDRELPGVEIAEVPCVVDRFIEARPAVRFPSMDRPVAYLGDLELVPLLCGVRDGMTSRALVRSWMPRVAPAKGLSIVEWLVTRGLLVRSAEAPVEIGRGSA